MIPALILRISANDLLCVDGADHCVVAIAICSWRDGCAITVVIACHV